jgi:heat shock protein 4
MMNQDRLIIETYEKKNELESLIYSWRERLTGSHKDYAKPE